MTSSPNSKPPAGPLPRKDRSRPPAPSTGEGADSALAALIKKRTPVPGVPPPPGGPDPDGEGAAG